MVFVDMDTEEILRSVYEKLPDFLRSYPRLYRPSCMMDILQMGENNLMKLRFSIDFKGNWQDGGKRWSTRTKFMFALKQILKDHQVNFDLPAQDIRIIDDIKK